eukprot:TRINITY_DN1033_c1_g1_i1.p1 TRINITY_DN1033_c1_g1~~TRINITY_DN1033_c1_g1_i1.p1  ORF type:complete len:476 (-),score=134.91 TRINITY_DN1033_c1_g1_i1:29-1456(-)
MFCRPIPRPQRRCKAIHRNVRSYSKKDHIEVTSFELPDAIKQASAGIEAILDAQKGANKIISIDTSALHQPPAPRHPDKPKPNKLESSLADAITAVGPMSVANFMRQVLMHPEQGYYVTEEPFGTRGDFITSPEISQVFGELVGIWCVNTWMQLGKPASFRLVELGPGRGTLMKDLLRAAKSFPSFYKAINLHLVERSPRLKEIQAKALDCKETDPSNVSTQIKAQGNLPEIPINWHVLYEEIPHEEDDMPMILIAHEFFDCLPINVFQTTPQGWREVLIDVDSSESANQFRMVVMKGENTASSMMASFPLAEVGERIETSPESIILVQKISQRIKDKGGAALIMDYGGDKPFKNSLRAIKDHKFVDPLLDVGSSDLSANVDFGSLRIAACESGVSAIGSVSQSDWLHRMGIMQRMAILMQNAKNEAEENDIEMAYERLTSETEMGQTYRFLTVYDSKLPIPAGFEEVEMSENAQ